MITKDNYKVALFFALLVVCCSVFLVGFTDYDTAYAENLGYTVEDIVLATPSGGITYDFDLSYTSASSEYPSILFAINNNSSNYLEYANYVIIFEFSNIEVNYVNTFEFFYYNDSSTPVLSLKDNLTDNFFCYLSSPCYLKGSSYYTYLALRINLVRLNSFIKGSLCVKAYPSDVISGEYMNGYNAGIEFADSRVNKDSLSYTTGVTDGITEADSRVNEDSASYIAGFKAGSGLDYEAGYQAGIAYADSRVNVDSASYNKGLQDGYLTGRLDGQKQAQYGLWYNSTFNLDAILVDEDDTLEKTYRLSNVNINKYLANYSFLTTELFQLCEKQLTGVYSGGAIREVTITITFADAIPWNNSNYGFIGDGASIGVTGFFTATDDTQYNIQVLYNDKLQTDIVDGKEWQLSSDANGKLMKSLSLTWKAAYNTFQSYVVTSLNGGFLSGYNQGYNIGLQDGEVIGYNKGSQVSENASYQLGYNKGYSEGVSISSDYSFNGLLTAVFDVPVKTFLSLFDFTFLGIDLKAVILSLLSICFFIAIWKFFSRLG